MWKCYIPIIGIYFAKQKMESENMDFNDFHYWGTALVHSISIISLFIYFRWLIV